MLMNQARVKACPIMARFAHLMEQAFSLHFLPRNNTQGCALG